MDTQEGNLQDEALGTLGPGTNFSWMASESNAMVPPEVSYLLKAFAIKTAIL